MGDTVFIGEIPLPSCAQALCHKYYVILVLFWGRNATYVPRGDICRLSLACIVSVREDDMHEAQSSINFGTVCTSDWLIYNRKPSSFTFEAKVGPSLMRTM